MIELRDNGLVSGHSPAVRHGIPLPAKALALGLIITDGIAVPASFSLAFVCYNHQILEAIRYRSSYDPTAFMLFGCALAPVMVFLFTTLGLYSRGVSALKVEEDINLLRGFLLITGIGFAVSFMLRDLPIPRLSLLMAFVTLPPLVIMGRRFVRHLFRWLARSGVGLQPVLIYGAGDTGKLLADCLLRNHQFGFMPVGFLDDEIASGNVAFGPGRSESLPILGRGEDLLERMISTGSAVLMVAMPQLGSDRLLEIQETCGVVGFSCFHVPLFAHGPMRRFEVTFLGDIPLVVERSSTAKLSHRFIKRAGDLFFGILFLAIVSPLLLLAIVLIKLTSAGPVLFIQERVGQFGKRFNIYKLRTMHVDAPAYAEKQSTATDERIFPVGKVLRSTSLDEFPQLINVLKGEMSLVGPRPEMPQIVESYDAVHQERLLVKPGMTGLWQVSGDRNFPIHENMDYDLYYIYNQSFMLDLVILIRTVFCLFTGR